MAPFNPFTNPRQEVDNDQVALFIDWDNLVISNYADRGSNRPNLEVLIQKAQQYGTLVIARAYAEWNNMIDRLEVYKSGVETVYAPVFHADRDLSGQTGRGKSLADPVMVTDCVDFLHLLPTVGTYVLVTGDKDMMPVVRLAKMRGRRVVVVGPDYVANVLQQICDEFVPYRVLLAQAAPPPDPYAIYYQQMGYVPPAGQYYMQGQTPPPPQQQQNNSRDRNGRRISSGRRGTPQPSLPQIQPYQQVQVPQTAQTYGMYNTYPVQQPPYTPPQGYAYPGYTQPQVPAEAQQPAPQFGYTQPQPQVAPPAPATPAPVEQPPAVVPQPAQQAPVKAVAAQPAQQPQAPARPASGQSTYSSNFEEIKDIIRQILTQRAGSGRGQMRARDLKEELLRRIPSFNERRYGYNKFKGLLSAVEEANVLQMDQIGHILWVSMPGTARGPVEETEYEDSEYATASESATIDTDLDDDDDDVEAALEEAVSDMLATDDVDEEAPELAAEADTPAVNAPVAEAATTEPETEAAEGSDEFRAEERTTTLVEAPIGAHTARFRQGGPAQGAKSEAGPKPALLEQPYYQDIILLVDNLRHRNKWLGYELLLSNVRDYLIKQGISESEAKSQAGGVLSRLLSEGVLRMAIEVHSRGARKMRVQVAYLQEEHRAVKYTLAAKHAPKDQAVTEEAPEAVVTEETQPVAELAQPVEAQAEAVQEAVSEEAQEAHQIPTHDYPLGYFGPLTYPESDQAAEQTFPVDHHDEVTPGGRIVPTGDEGHTEQAATAEAQLMRAVETENPVEVHSEAPTGEAPDFTHTYHAAGPVPEHDDHSGDVSTPEAELVRAIETEAPVVESTAEAEGPTQEEPTFEAAPVQAVETEVPVVESTVEAEGPTEEAPAEQMALPETEVAGAEEDSASGEPVAGENGKTRRSPVNRRRPSAKVAVAEGEGDEGEPGPDGGQPEGNQE